MLERTFELMLCFIETFSIFLYLNRLFRVRNNSRIMVWLAAVSNALIIFLLPELNYIKVIITVIIITVTSLLTFRVRYYTASLFALIFIYVFYIIDVITGNLISVIVSENIINIMYDNFVHRVIISLIVKLLDILVLYYVYRQFKNVEMNIPEKKFWLLFNFVIFVFLVITAMFMVLYTADSRKTHSEELYLVLSLLFFAMSMVVIRFLTYILKSSRDRQKLAVLNSNFEAIRESLLLQSSNADKMSKVRHDIKNHLTLVRTLLEQKKYDEAREALSYALAQTDEITISLKTSSNNSIIDAIVLSKAATCSANQIKFEYYLDTLPELSMDILDISSLLSNMLDNAIEAAMNSDDPYVLLKIVILNNHLNFFVKNSFVTEPVTDQNSKRIITSKIMTDGIPHGYGTIIINDIAEKYSGSFDWKTDDNFFLANVFMPIS